VKPIYLQRSALDCALGATLDEAAASLLAGRIPKTEDFILHEVQETRRYLSAAGPTGSLEQRLDNCLAAVLGSQPQPLDDCLLIVASTSLDINTLEALTRRQQGFYPENSTHLDRLASELRQRWGFAAAFTLNTACTSAANGLLYGARLVNADQYARALVLSFETPSAIAMQGFGALGLTSPSGDYRPFHPERDGLLLGEAYAAVLLSRDPGDAPLARLLGGFSACDTSSLTTTREDGSHIHWVMQQALHSAGCSAAQIDLVKLHGTATSANDEAESNGMRLLYGKQMPALSLLKPWLGHTLGACGLSESLLLLKALQNGLLPGVSYASEAMLPFSTEAQALPADSLLLANFFGFGGNNASLVLQGWPGGEQPCQS
jgi:3-oxoacyl-[acyl-carrier-protein] synthase I